MHERYEQEFDVIRSAQLNLILLAAISGIARLAVADVVSPGATTAQSPLPPKTISIPLEYREVKFPIAGFRVSLTSRNGDRSTSIKKSPDTKGAKLIYGAIEMGKDRIALAWDKSQRKLYLDLNRNQDLTDDPDGVFSASGKGSYQTFTNIHLSATNPSGEWRLLMDLNLYDFGRGSMDGYASLRSFYEGQVELAGKSWQVGYVKELLRGTSSAESDRLLLRPWEARAQAFSLNDRSADTCALRQKLFLQDQAYGTKVSFEKEGGASKLKLELTPQQTPLGELKLSGEYVHRLVLEGARDCTAVFDAPPSVLQVPLGTYHHVQVRLKKGDDEAFGDFDVKVAVTDKTAATLPVGGPLTNSVAVSRAGHVLRLSYQLVGSGGKPYALVYQGQRKAPEFAIYKGDRRLAGGKFEFG